MSGLPPLPFLDRFDILSFLFQTKSLHTWKLTVLKTKDSTLIRPIAALDHSVSKNQFETNNCPLDTRAILCEVFLFFAATIVPLVEFHHSTTFAKAATHPHELCCSAAREQHLDTNDFGSMHFRHLALATPIHSFCLTFLSFNYQPFFILDKFYNQHNAFILMLSHVSARIVLLSLLFPTQLDVGTAAVRLHTLFRSTAHTCTRLCLEVHECRCVSSNPLCCCLVAPVEMQWQMDSRFLKTSDFGCENPFVAQECATEHHNVFCPEVKYDETKTLIRLVFWTTVFFWKPWNVWTLFADV